MHKSTVYSLLKKQKQQKTCLEPQEIKRIEIE